MKFFYAAFAMLVCAVAPHLAVAQSVESFYKGRTITLIVPTSAGGVNDLAGRLVGRHLGQFIPGNPNIVVENQPGGAGIVAANKLYNTTEKDGLTIAIIQRGTPQVHRCRRFDGLRERVVDRLVDGDGL